MGCCSPHRYRQRVPQYLCVAGVQWGATDHEVIVQGERVGNVCKVKVVQQWRELQHGRLWLWMHTHTHTHTQTHTDTHTDTHRHTDTQTHTPGQGRGVGGEENGKEG